MFLLIFNCLFAGMYEADPHPGPSGENGEAALHALHAFGLSAHLPASAPNSRNVWCGLKLYILCYRARGHNIGRYYCRLPAILHRCRTSLTLGLSSTMSALAAVAAHG